MDKSIIGRLERLEALSARSERRDRELQRIDVRDHIAGCYVPLHEDIQSGGHEFYNLPGGRGSGKSSFVSLELVNGIMQDRTCQSNALVVRKYAVTLRGSVFSQIQWAINALGVADRWKATVSPLEFTFETGQVIRLTGLDDPQKLKSMKPSRGYFRFLWLEEFSEINGEVELRNLQQSVLRGGSGFVVFRSFNPPMSKSNWANAFISIPDPRSVTLLTNYTMIPLEWLGQQFFDEAERLKQLNERAYRNEYLGEAVGSGGAVFPNVEVKEISDEEIQQQEYVYIGIDWGFASDPACVIRCSYDGKKDRIMVMDEIFERGLSNKQLYERIIDKRLHCWGGYMLDVIADSAEPKSIADMFDLGLKIRKCHKEPGCVEYRIKWLQHRQIVIDPSRTPNTYRELINYEYDQDRAGNFLPSVPDHDNHAIDALAYALDRLIYRRGVSA